MTTKKKQGFTIIEVVLVLAIAGLIFLVVFLALPALQRSQRDTQRKNDVGRFTSQISSYQSNNRGSIPTTSTELGTFVSTYLRANGDTFDDPSTGAYNVTLASGLSDVPTAPGSMKYRVGAKCGTNGAFDSGTARQAAVAVYLEGGGIYCQQN